LYICGEIHYFRVPKPLWRDRLLKLKRAGGNCVSIYIPWNWHSPREDIVDFEDKYRQWHVAKYYSRNLADFLEQASRLGLKVIARPGPYICSEWDSGGHPNWLYTKTSKLRSLDPLYIEYTRKWYEEVYRVLKLFIERNIVTAIQVENEYFWGNEKYIEELYNIVKRLDPNMLVFTNENYYLSSVPNTIDDYPAPWNIKPFEEKVRRYLSHQPGLFKMFAELEGGWYRSTRYGYNPTNRLSIPAEWTELLIKTAFAMGLDNFNIYMFHGGSNPGYYTGKYIDSSYDFEASIREWGELSERYYKVKRVFMFMDSFKDLIMETKPVQGVIKPASSNCSEVFTRIGEHGKIIVLRNKSDFTCYEKLVYGDKIIPEKAQIRVPPRYAKTILLDLVIKESPFKISYTTGEVLLKKNIDNGTSVLVVYGDPGELTETRITCREEIKQVYTWGDVSYQVDASRKIATIEARHGRSDTIFLAESLSGSRLVIVYTTRFRAERTWVLDNTVIISNAYYIGEYGVHGNSICLESELDRASCGEATIITPLELEEALMGESGLELKKIVDGVYKVHIPYVYCREQEALTYQTNRATLIEDPIWDKMKPIPPASPLEKNGFYENGIYVYKVRFEINGSILGKLSNKIIALAGFCDYAVLSINGVHTASGYHYIEGDATKSLKEGINEAVIVLEATGHPNDGLLYVPNGVYTGMYLGKKQDIPINTWYKYGLKLETGPEFDFAEFLSKPMQVLKTLSKLDYRGLTRVSFIDTSGLYIGEIYIDNPKYHYIFDPGEAFYYNHYHRILLFINDVYVGAVIGPIEITSYLKPGLNKIALFVEWGIASPVIRVFEYKVDGEWFLQEGTHGLVNEWYRKPIPGGHEILLPIILEDMAGRVIWVRTRMRYDREPSTKHPVKIFIDSWGARLLVFVNGHLVGRLGDDSAGKELYVPEPALRKGVNDISLLAIISSNNAGIGGIGLREVYRHEVKEICFYERT